MIQVLLFIVVVVVVVAFLLSAGLPRVTVPREPEPTEGIDDEGLTSAYGKMQGKNPFVFYRAIVLEQLLNPGNGTGPTTGDTLLDIGCGTGDFLVQLGLKLKEAGIDFDLHGLDISKEILKICKENLDKSGVVFKALEHADAASTSFPSNHFSIVTTSNSLHHWIDPVKVFNEIHRILKPGGRFILMDFRRDARRFYWWYMRFVRRFIGPKALRDAGEPITSLISSYTREEIHELLENSAWKDVDYRFKGTRWVFVVELRKNA